MEKIEFINEQKIIYDVPFLASDLNEFVLWFFTGSRCNLTCTHCYVESSPTNDSMPYLTYETFEKRITEAVSKNFKTLDIYYTQND